MTVDFYKYHGTGNDFIMINGFDYPNLELSSESIAKFCHRRFGIGSDGLIIINKSEKTDFRMSYYNSDGYEGTMCGNGGRCSAFFARQMGVIDKKTVFETVDGIHEAEITDKGLVKLKMADVENINKIDEGYLIDTGSPHFVLFDNYIEDINIDVAGKKLRYDKRFGEDGVNVNFVQNNGRELKVRTYERGVEAETYSCGTGAVAVALVNYMNSQQLIPESIIETKGGELKVKFEVRNDSFSNIWLEGPAEFVYRGELIL